MSNADIKDFLAFIQTVPYGGNIYKSSVKTIRTYDNKKNLKVPLHYLLLPTLLLRLFFYSFISVTNTVTAFQKKYQFFFEIVGGSLIVNLNLWGKCGLRKLTFHQPNTKVEKERKLIVMREMWKMNIISKTQDHENHVKQHYRRRKTTIRLKKKSNFLLLTEMMILIYIHAEIKPIRQKLWSGAVFRFCRFEGNMILPMMTGRQMYLLLVESECHLKFKESDN